MIISMSYKLYKKEYDCGSLKRNSSVPLLSFYFIFLLFLFFSIFCGLHGSFYLTLICPLWDRLICPLWDLFLTLGATLYILQKYRRSLTLYKGTQHKEKCNYHDANVCLCQGSRICNDTSASCSNELACGSSIKQVAC